MLSQRNEAYRLLRASIRKRSATCAVIGLGYVGATMVEAIGATGFRVYGYDRAQGALCRTRDKLPAIWQCRLGQDEKEIQLADIVCVAVRVVPTTDGSVDLEPIQSAVKLAFENQDRPRLVLLHSTIPLGTTRKLLADGRGGRYEPHLFLAHCPERLQTGNSQWNLHNVPHLVGGMDDLSTRLAAQFLSTTCESVVPVSAPEVSELSKLLENAFMSTGIALVGEITKMAHRVGVTAGEVTRAAATKPFGYYPFHPGPGIGGHCLPNDLKMLRASQHAVHLDTSLLDCISRLVKLLPEIVVDRLEAILAGKETGLKGARVLLVGIGFKVGSYDPTGSPALDIVRILRARGALPAYCDSRNECFTVDDTPVDRVDPDALRQVEPFNAGILLAGDTAVDAQALEDHVDVLLDTGGARVVKGRIKKTYAL